MSRVKDITGQKFGRLTVLSESGRDSNGHVIWNCVCECGNKTSVSGYHLRSGKTKSCGCFWKERVIEGSTKHNKKYNEFYVENDIVFVKLSNSEKTMMVDLDEWDRWASGYLWRLNSDGYAQTVTRQEGTFCYHVRAFPDCPDENVRDHIDGNRLNNTRKNIRFVNLNQNMFNRKLGENNKSGCTGVYFHKETGKWAAQIKFYNKKIHLGLFEEKEDAISARKKAELELFGEYRRK